MPESEVGPANPNLHSFSGTDIRCTFYFRESNAAISANGESSIPFRLHTTAELQTLTVSSMRTTGPVRSLGESAARDYTRGPRTVAGSMIFTVVSDDVFSIFYQVATRERLSREPFFVDQIPNFDIVIHGEDEFLDTKPARAVVLDCTLVNFGTTFSIHDLLLESTYTYEARGFLPFVRDPKKVIKAHRTGADDGVLVTRASELPVSSNK